MNLEEVYYRILTTFFTIIEIPNTILFTLDDGTFRVVSSNKESEQEEQLWTSSAKCPVR